VDRIKRLSYEVLDGHKSKFGEDFVDNKKALNEISIIRSKGLKNKMAGYITKFVKKEIREEKAKQSRIESSKSEQQMQDQTDTVIVEPAIIEEETPETVTETASVEETPETVTETASVEETPETVTETASVEETPEEKTE
jgi:small subunit ribosomal protein S17e